MSRAMFMLIGDQTIPNLMPLLQLHAQTASTDETAHLYRVVLVTTADRSIKPNAAKIRKCFAGLFSRGTIDSQVCF